jgi:hypothetical protein
MTSLITLTEDSGWSYSYRSDPAFDSLYSAIEAGTPNNMGFNLNPNGMLMFHTRQGNRICLPADKLCETLPMAHNIIGHFG